MKILSFGSLNIDHVYMLNDFVRPGETLSCDSYRMNCGGKGLNQSIALASAGADVYHAGKVGKDGSSLINTLEERGVNTDLIEVCGSPSGHAVIQVTSAGENSIIIHDGANGNIDGVYIDKVFSNFSSGDCLLIQNEINMIPEIMTKAHKKQMKIFFNPAPMSSAVPEYPLEYADFLIFNETEGGALSGRNMPEEILAEIGRKYPESSLVLTLGSRGVMYKDMRAEYYIPARKTEVVDTTAAGDTFCGFFIAGLMKNMAVDKALGAGNDAAAVCVGRKGAAVSIPYQSGILEEK